MLRLFKNQVDLNLSPFRTKRHTVKRQALGRRRTANAADVNDPIAVAPGASITIHNLSKNLELSSLVSWGLARLSPHSVCGSDFNLR